MHSEVCRACMRVLDDTVDGPISIFQVYQDVHDLPVMIYDIFKIKVSKIVCWIEM